MRDVSAWAGIHYFASREPEDKGPLTWPEGNGWIARRLLEKLARYVRTGSPVYRVAPDGNRVRVFTEQAEYIADAVVFAAPTFLAPYIIEGAGSASGFVYSPWLTANLTLERPPREKTIEPAWDNVIYDSPALGYVDATHMSLASNIVRNVWTYYWSFAEYAPDAGARPAARQGLELLERSDSQRSLSRAPRHPRVRFARGHHEDRPRHDPADSRISVEQASRAAIAADSLRQFRP